MYEAALLEAVPNLFWTTIRDILNESLDPGDAECPELDFGDELIDFRDFFLEPEDAMSSGGSGEGPYGSLGPTVFTVLQEILAGLDDDGLSNINSLLLRPFMESQSGDQSLLSLASSLFDFSSDPTSFEFAIFNATVRNLDTVTAPISIIQPSTNPHVLQNVLNVGPAAGRPVNASVGVRIALEGEGSPFKAQNELDISASIDSSILSADVLARLRATYLMQFPLRDILNINCWLSVFESPTLDADGFKVDQNAEPGLGLTQFLLTLTTLSVDVNCISCTSPGVEALPNLLNILEQEGSFTILRSGIESLAAEILLSDDLVQTQIDRLLSDAPKFCPHRSQYTENAVSTNFGFQAPVLSRDAVETGIYIVNLVVEVGLVVFAESHVLFDISTSDFLEGQNSLEVPDGTRLLDLSTLGDMATEWFDVDLNGYLGGPIEDIGGPNGDEDLGVNVWLRDFLLDEDRAFSIGLGGIGYTAGESGEMRIAGETLRIIGLDTFTKFKALDPVANQTFRNLFGWKELNVEIDLLVQTSDDTGTLTISLGVEQVDAALSLLLAIDLDLLGELEFGSLLWIDQILPCFLSSAVAAELTELLVTVGDVRGPTYRGFLSENMESAIANVTEAIFDKNNYRERLVSAVPGMFDTALRATVNNWMNHYLRQEQSVSCPKAATERMLEETRSVDFRDLFLGPGAAVDLGGDGAGRYGNLFRTLRDILNNEVLTVDPSGLSGVNDFIVSPFTKGQSGKEGTLVYEGDLLNTKSSIWLGDVRAVVRLGLFNARIENLNTIGEPLSLLEPLTQKPHELNNTAGSGVGPDPLRFAATLLLVIDGRGETQSRLRNEVDISIALSTATVVLEVLAKIAESPFLSFPLKDLINLDCWLATIPGPELDASGVRAAGEAIAAALSRLDFAVGDVVLNATCIECSSSYMQEFTELLSSPEASGDVNEVAKIILDTAADFLEGFLQLQLDRRLADAPKKCPHNREFDENYGGATYEPLELQGVGGNSQQFLLVVTSVCIVVAVLVLLFAIRAVVRRRHAKWLRSLPAQSVVILHREQDFQREQEAELNSMSKSMFCSSAIPRYVRWTIPVVILGNIALFLSGHLSLAGSIIITGEFANEEFSIDNFFEFSIANSVFRIWNAGGYAMSILAFIFSIMWPYSKQGVSLVLWFLPPSRMPVSRRGTIFLWLDSLAKWSMIDVFILVVTVAAFQLNIESPTVSFLPDDFYSIRVSLAPLWGLYANMTAQLVSQVSSHFIIHFHRRVVQQAQQDYDKLEMPRVSTDVTEDSDQVEFPGGTSNIKRSRTDSRRKRLCDQSFARPHRGESDKVRTRRMVNPLVIFCLVVITVMIVMGCILPTFSVQLLGLVGLVVEAGQAFESATTNYNVFSIVAALFDQAKLLGGAGDYIGLGTLSALLVATVLLVPLTQSVMLLRQWFRPMDDRTHRRNQVAIEVLAAWQYAEVYLLSAILAAWQLGPISKFMLNEPCKALEGLFATLVLYDIMDPSDAVCFRIDANVEGGAFVFATGAIVLALLNTFVNKAFSQHQRDISEATILHDDPKLSVRVDSVDESDVDISIAAIRPSPVLFTDTFRWLLEREDVRLNQTPIINPKKRYSNLDDCPQQVVASGLVVDVESDTSPDEMDSPYHFESPSGASDEPFPAEVGSFEVSALSPTSTSSMSA